MGYKAVASAKRQMGQRSGVRSTAPSDSLFRQRSGTYPLNGAGLFVFQIWLSTGFWLSLASVVPGHASLGGCWILAQHGMGGAWPCFAWRVLDSGSAWDGWSLAMLSLGGAGAVLRSLRPPATSRASYVSVRRPRSCW